MAYIGAGITRFNTADDLTVTDDAEIGGDLTVTGSADINGGTIDGVTIGGASAGAGTFTTLQADTSLNVDGTVTADGLTVNSGSTDLGTRFESTDGTAGIAISDNTGSVGLFARDTGEFSINVGGDASSSASNASEALRIDSSGNVGIGTNSPSSLLELYSDNPRIVLSDLGTQAKITNLSGNLFYDTSSSNRDHIFEGAGSEVARITGDGLVGIGTTSPDSPLTVKEVSNTAIHVLKSNDSSLLKIGEDGSGNAVYNATLTGAHIFQDNGTEHARIDSSGNLLVGGTTFNSNAESLPVDTFAIDQSTGTILSHSSKSPLELGRTSGDTVERTLVNFFREGSLAGRVRSTDTTTSYETSSDYRLKENVVDMTDAIDRVKALQVRRFNFIASPDITVDGFLAHEAQAVVPEAVSGTKDEVDAEGNPEYQGIDQAKLVPLLTGALKEAIARIETLEAEVATLKGN